MCYYLVLTVVRPKRLITALVLDPELFSTVLVRILETESKNWPGFFTLVLQNLDRTPVREAEKIRIHITVATPPPPTPTS
jgi:hypothetical protein